MMRLVFVIAALLWICAAGRDEIDRWVDRTALPALALETSVTVHDRDGALLRAYTVADGRWRLPITVEMVDPTYLQMLVRYEDKRYWEHNGVDRVAMVRAVGQAIRNGQIVSGGSTLTMQVARLLEEGSTGSWAGKLRQVRVALALERRLTKTEILTIYLHLAPFGGNLEGIAAASHAYFQRPASRLTPAQSALLVALPQSPETRRPDRAPAAATRARDRVLDRMITAGLIDKLAARPMVPTVRHPLPSLAPHLADTVIAQSNSQGRHRMTLNHALQISMETLAEEAVAFRSDGVQVAIMVADHQTGEILASVGSVGYGSERNGGFLDLTQAVRSPGSTLKPLIYGIGFDRGLIHPETMIADRPTDFGGYAPQNFDGVYRGALHVRKALQHSLNIPAVAVTQSMGPQHLIAGLERAGADVELPAGKPGLAIALGGIGLRLHDLTALYAAIANDGVAVDLRWHEEPSTGFAPRQIMNRAAAWYVADILAGTPRPRGITATGIAFKTGTSYGHRDAWAMGFDGRHVVGVWMGRADATSVPGAFGGELAAPVMFAAFARIKPEPAPIGPPPPEALLLPTAQLPEQLRSFGDIETLGVPRLQVAFPPDGAILEHVDVIAKLRGGRAPYIWLLDGQPVARTRRPEAEIRFPNFGFASLTAIDADGNSASSAVTLR